MPRPPGRWVSGVELAPRGVGLLSRCTCECGLSLRIHGRALLSTAPGPAHIYGEGFLVWRRVSHEVTVQPCVGLGARFTQAR